ncbi:hypothetical protein OAJ56_02140 [Flavobacteriales bacterium]|nr:hypothetical protein [Flavobacteriales bacterium]
MKKLLLILLCVPLIFSCGEKEEKNEENIQKEEKKVIEGYWEIENVNPYGDDFKCFWYFSEDGSFCNSVRVNYYCEEKELIQHCDDCDSYSWKYINNGDSISMQTTGDLRMKIVEARKNIVHLKGFITIVLKKTTLSDIEEYQKSNNLEIERLWWRENAD